MARVFVHIVYILSFCTLLLQVTSCQNISINVNPGCLGDVCKWRHLGYVNHSSSDVSHHYYFDVLTSSLAFVIVDTLPNEHSSDGHINWTRLADKSDVGNAITYKNSTNAIAFVLGNLTLVQESQKEGQSTNITVLGYDQFDLQIHTEQKDDGVSFSPFLKYNHPLFRNFNVTLNITVATNTERHGSPPGLLYNPASIHVDLIMKGPIPHDKTDYNITLPFQLIQFGSFSEGEQETIDDEFSPGVFALHTLKAVESLNSTTEETRKSFVQYRPVAYLSPDHISTLTLDTSLSKTNETVVPWNENSVFTSAAYGYFANLNANNYSFVLTLPAAKMYSKTNYTSFSFTVGLGDWPTEQVSRDVILIIVLGFALPSLALVMGMIYLGYKKFTSRRAGLVQQENE